MNAQEIRNAYLKFFKDRSHKVIPRALLVPDNDPTTLFTGSGMQPLIRYLLGEKHPDGTKLTDSQTCLRAMDIEEVGDNRHTTFFEMLGNWSLGDYFKQEQITWFFEFLTEVVGLDPNKLYVTTFIGNSKHNIPKDIDSAEIWKTLFAKHKIEVKEADIDTEEAGAIRGMNPGERIFYYGEKNWWCRPGKIDNMPIGEPGGPDTEVFYEFDFVEHNTEYGEKCHPNCDCGRFIEIGNSVFMEYVRTENGFEKLPKQNVDFGGGLERIAQAAIDSPDMFKISLLWPIVKELERLSGKPYDSHTNSMRVIADHLRGATFLAVDGVKPSNKEQGYVMRRLLRRAIRFAFELGIEQNFLQDVVPVIAKMYEEDFPEVKKSKVEIIETLVKEEKTFRQTLRKGMREMHKMGKSGKINGEQIFTLYDTYGFPTELSTEEALIQGFDVEADWRKQFDSKMKEQRERSQTAAKGTFKGGLGGQKDIHKKYHTATHLMYESLRRILGDHVIQHGSNITEERLRFDFSHPEKVTAEQLKQVEDMVNQQIEKDLTVTFEEHPKEYALKELKPLGHFGDRYGDIIKIYRMQSQDDKDPFSYEICGGPHVDNTGHLAEGGKRFKIKKEEASSAGIRRIKAVLE
ncbi:alanine--tRNA ligase [Candidatus Saccharibacteria bacterium]|nr:alanine--tRNA ligase [Candidatus Saccharibacteria bacterium]